MKRDEKDVTNKLLGAERYFKIVFYLFIYSQKQDVLSSRLRPKCMKENVFARQDPCWGMIRNTFDFSLSENIFVFDSVRL